MPQMQGVGPLPPRRPVQPITGIESGAPAERKPGLQPMNKLGPMGGGMQPLKPLQPMVPMVQDSPAPQPVFKPIDAMSAPYEEPPVIHHKTLAGFLDNFGQDVKQFIEGIPAAFKVAGQSGAYIVKNAKWLPELMAHPEVLGEELKKTGVAAIQAITDTYKDGVGEALYKHPWSVLMDATMVADILGGGVKMASRAALSDAGKASLKTLVSKSASTAEKMAAKATLEASLDAGGYKMFQLGDKIATLPGRIAAAPFKAIGKAAMKVPIVDAVVRGQALSPYGLQQSKRIASHILEEGRADWERMKEVFAKSIPKKDWDEFHELVTGYKPLEAASSPELAERVTRWKEANAHHENWLIHTTIKSPEELRAAELKPLAERLFNEGKMPHLEELYKRGDRGEIIFKQEALDAAKAWQEGANPWNKPTTVAYEPYFKDRGNDLLSFLESTKPEATTLGYVKRFEKKGLGGNIIRNPDEIQARAAVAMSHLRGMVNYINEVILSPKALTVKVGSELPKGYVHFDPVLLRYLDRGLIPAHEAMIAKVTRELHLNPNQSYWDVLKTAAKETEAEILPDALKAAREVADNPKAWEVAIPVEDAYLIESQLRGVSGPLRFYDKILNTWRNVVLRLMPRYYVNNLLGNSILLMFGGHTPFAKTAVDHKILPAEAVEASGLMSETGRHPDFLSHVPGMKSLNKVTDILAAKTDSVPRGLLVGQKAKEVLAHDAAMGDQVALAMLAQDSMEGAVSEAFKARRAGMPLGTDEAVASKKVRMSLTDEKTVGKLDEDVRKLQAQIDAEHSVPSANSAQKMSELQAQIDMKLSQRVKISEEMTARGPIADQMRKLIEVQQQRARLAPVAAYAERAVSEMERFLGAYGRSHPLERQWIRRVIPFWQFMKTMNKLVFMLPFTNPKTAFLWHHYAKLMIDSANDDRLPSRFRNMIPIGAAKDGQTVFMKIGGFNPFEAVGTGQIGGMDIPKLVDPAQNPLVKMMIETRGGYDTFTERPFTEKTDFVSLDGSVWRFNPDTQTLESVIPQKPLVSSLLGQIPHMRVIQELLDSMGARKTANVTRQDPEGNYMYDRSPLWAASRAMGMPVSVSDPERVKWQHDLLVKGMIKRFRSAGKRVDPDTQKKLERILSDLDAGGWELREW